MVAPSSRKPHPQVAAVFGRGFPETAQISRLKYPTRSVGLEGGRRLIKKVVGLGVGGFGWVGGVGGRWGRKAWDVCRH